MQKWFLLVCLVFFTWHMKAQSNLDTLKKHVVKLSELPFPRNAKNPIVLQDVAAYIKKYFLKATSRTFLQNYDVQGNSFKNVIASFGPTDGPRMIIGANYDTYENSPGADANASGLAGLLELAQLFSKVDKALDYRIDLVAYPNSDETLLGKSAMGSYQHAKSLRDNLTPVLGMINLQGIGFYTDKPHSQKYPFWGMRFLYGHRGNFVWIMQNVGNGSWGSRMRGLMQQYIIGMKAINFKPIIYTEAIGGSDHCNYWDMGFPAMMITNSSGYRNKNFHYDTDTYETLDYFRMKKVVDMVYQAVLHFRS